MTSVPYFLPMKTHDPATAIADFSKMGLSPTLLAALEKGKFVSPTQIQSESIPLGLAGEDLIGVAQTGSGKTLAYALAVVSKLEKNPQARALILSPSRETAEQVHWVVLAICAELKITVCLAVPGVTIATQSNQLKKNPRIIVATPGRINDHLQHNKLLLKGLEILVIDEADRMLDLGFEPQLKFMQSTLRGTRQTMMFAASFGPRAEPVAKMFLNENAILIRSQAAETPVPTLEQKVFFLSGSQKEHRLLDELKVMKGGVIVFADSKESCTTLGRLLAHNKFSSDFIHGDMNPGHRNRVLSEFRDQRLQILVTTDLLARGLDVAHVNHVVNFDLPYKSDDFLHRIGRTARAGREGTAITFVTPADGRTFRKIKPYLQNATEKTLNSSFKFTE
mgnify:CR=1 FL=1